MRAATVGVPTSARRPGGTAPVATAAAPPPRKTPRLKRTTNSTGGRMNTEARRLKTTAPKKAGTETGNCACHYLPFGPTAAGGVVSGTYRREPYSLGPRAQLLIAPVYLSATECITSDGDSEPVLRSGSLSRWTVGWRQRVQVLCMNSGRKSANKQCERYRCGVIEFPGIAIHK